MSCGADGGGVGGGGLGGGGNGGGRSQRSSDQIMRASCVHPVTEHALLGLLRASLEHSLRP